MATEIWTFQDRSLATLDLSGFQVETRDGVVGRVDRATREVGGSYLVIDPGASMPLGRRLLVPAGIIDTVDATDRRVFVDASRDELLSAPEFDTDRSLDTALRDRLAAHFSRGRTRSSRGSSSSSRSRSRSSTTSSSRSRSRSSSTKRRSRSSASNEPTKEQLYQQAKRVRIEGRSKMNKAQLKRAVERRK